jgi:hypothetical protein
MEDFEFEEMVDAMERRDGKEEEEELNQYNSEDDYMTDGSEMENMPTNEYIYQKYFS